MGVILSDISGLFFKYPVFLEFSYSLNVTNNLIIFCEHSEIQAIKALHQH